MLVEHGIYHRKMNLELARDRVYEFTFVSDAAGAGRRHRFTGRPLALVAADPDGDTGDGDGQVPEAAMAERGRWRNSWRGSPPA